MKLSDGLLWILERILGYFGQGDVIKNIREKRKNKKINDKYFNEINNFYKKKFKVPMKEIHSNELFDRSEAYEFWVNTQFELITPEKRNILVLLALCFEYSNSKDVDTYAAIKGYVDTINISFSNMSDETKYLLNAYSNLFKNEEKYGITEIFTGKEGIDYKSLLKEFANSYNKDLALRFVSEELAQSEELRDTLVRLITEGRLATYGVNKSTLDTLEKELKARTNYAKTFVVLGNKLPEPIENYLKKQPRIGAVGSSTRIPGYRRNHKFSIYIVRPIEGFRTSNELLEKFKNLTKTAAGETTVQIMPIDGISILQYNFPANQSFSNVNIKYASALLSFFKAGVQYSDADIWNILLKSEIGINNLLALIPFNILVPGIYPSEKEFIIRNYPQIKEQMSVETLVDWADKDPILLKEVLTSIGTITYTNEERSALGSKDRLMIIAESIVSNSKKLKASLSNLLT